MFRIPSAIIILLFAYPISAQTLENQFYGNPIGADLIPEDLVALEDGSAVITGKTNTPDADGYHVFLLQTDSLGSLLWQKTYSQGSGNHLIKTPDGGYLVGGSSKRHIFGPDKGMLLKVDGNGQEAWTEYIPQGDHSYITDVTNLASGEFAICGVVVNEGNNASQDVFWATYAPSGGLTQYQTLKNYGTSYDPSIVENKEGNLILGWICQSGDRLVSVTPGGQTLWEHNLGDELEYDFGARGSLLLVDSTGDLWVAGGNKFNLSGISADQVFQFSSTGTLKHIFGFEAHYPGAAALFPGPNGTLNYWTPNRYSATVAPGYIQRTLSNQGILLSTDTVTIPLYAQMRGLAEVNKNRLLFLYSSIFPNSNTKVQPIQKVGPEFQLLDPWELSTGLPYSHEYYEAHCASLSGGSFVLSRGLSKSLPNYDLGIYVLRTDEHDNEAAWTYLGEDNTVRGGQIQACLDGGAIALGYSGTVYKLNAAGQLQWTKPSKRGKLALGADDDFFIISAESQPSIFDPILIYHYDQNGDSIGLNSLYSKSQFYQIEGVLRQVDNGPMLYGLKYDTAGLVWRNWIIYLDKDGNVVSDNLLSAEYPAIDGFNTRAIKTTDGGALIASQFSSGIQLLHLIDNKVSWTYPLLNNDPDSISMQLVSIEEVPCQGYVLAFETNVQPTHNESTKLLILHHVNEDGQGKDFYAYKPLLGQVNLDTSFLPGYTFRRWGHQFNQQTYDLLLQTIHFPDSNALALPAEKLNIFPNPSESNICLQYESPFFGLLDIRVYNAAGQLVDGFKTAKTTRNWEFHYQSEQPSGVYFIQIVNGSQERRVERWVKGN